MQGSQYNYNDVSARLDNRSAALIAYPSSKRDKDENRDKEKKKDQFTLARDAREKDRTMRRAIVENSIVADSGHRKKITPRPLEEEEDTHWEKKRVIAGVDCDWPAERLEGTS